MLLPLLDEALPTGDPITPAPYDGSVEPPGPVGLGPPAVRPAGYDGSVEPPGPVGLRDLDPDELRPITPAPVVTTEMVPGPLLYQPTVWPPTYPDPGAFPGGPPVAIAALTVTGYPQATNITAQPKANDVGTASFTTPGAPPAVDTIVGINAGGVRVFTGLVESAAQNDVASGEEADQTSTVRLESLLREWEDARVLPDFGAQEINRLGPPTQDTRFFDWSMNGIGTDDSADQDAPSITSSVGYTSQYGTPAERFPMPDVWPAPKAKWMWSTSGATARAGYVFFRIPFLASGKIQLWCCAYDYAEVWLDGVLVATCDSAGVAAKFQITLLGSNYHNLKIRAHNGGGKAGVLAAVMPVEPSGLFGDPIVQSGGGWDTIAYPDRTFRLNPGQVVRRLQYEARRRGVANIPGWALTFNASMDSAGRAWPDDTDPIAVQVGSTYLDVLRQMAAALVDITTAKQGRVLNMYIKGLGTNASHASPLGVGTNIVSRTTTRSRG